MWRGSTGQRPPRSSLCWLLTGWGRAAELGLQLLFGPLLLAPPPLFLPSSPSLRPLWSCWAPATEVSSADMTVGWKRFLNPFELELVSGRGTHKLQHVPVEDVVVGEALSVEKVPEELPKIRVVRLVIKPQRATQVQVSGELSWETQETERCGF